jgi:hypothetical protein
LERKREYFIFEITRKLINLIIKIAGSISKILPQYCAVGKIVLISRMLMNPIGIPLQFKKLQFPIEVSFVITINKAQE